MSEWDEKLGAILSDQDAMKKIMSIAQSLTGPSQSAGRSREDAPPDPQPDSDLSHAGGDSTPDSGKPGQELPDLSGLLGNLDPKWVALGMRLLSSYRGGDDDRAALLNALRPFVKSSRYEKLDKAVEIARLSRVVRLALDALKGGDDDHV